MPPTAGSGIAYKTPHTLFYVQVVMLGLDAAGKTTILYRLHIGEVLSTVPTIGMALQGCTHARKSVPIRI